MDPHSVSSGSDSAAGLVRGFSRVCGRATAMKCIHQTCAKKEGRSNQVLFGAVVIINALAACLLAGGLREMLPRAINLMTAAMSAVAAICTGLALAFDYKGKAARHSELSTCYAALALSCQADMDRFNAGQLAAMQFDTILGCNVGILKELELRSHGLDSSCTIGSETPANKPLQPTSGAAAIT